MANSSTRQQWRRLLVDKFFLASLVVAFMVLVLALMGLGWYLRRRRQRDIPATAAVPAELGETTSYQGFYVSTSKAENPLERIAVRGLGFRARTSVIVSPLGVVIPIRGQADVFIPTADIRGMDRATWTIDRGVEPDGLSVLDWTLGDTNVASYFRLENPEGFSQALSALIKTGTK
jgi:hypothetical protein